MRLSLIAAVADDGVIGENNSLPWRQKDDLRRFRDLTRGNPVIMGRKTYDSLPEGRKPLPDRPNIIITRDTTLVLPGCTVVHSLQEAIVAAEQSGATEAFVIGGAQIYNLSLDAVDRIYLTMVHTTVPDGDAIFPTLDTEKWQEIEHVDHDADDNNDYPYTYSTFDRAAVPSV